MAKAVGTDIVWDHPIDSKRDPRFYCRQGMAAAHANTKKSMRDCNALLVTDPVTSKIKLTTMGKDIPPYGEIFAFYPCAIWAADARRGKEIKIQERKEAKAAKAAELAGKKDQKTAMAKRARTH